MVAFINHDRLQSSTVFSVFHISFLVFSLSIWCLRLMALPSGITPGYSSRIYYSVFSNFIVFMPRAQISLWPAGLKKSIKKCIVCFLFIYFFLHLRDMWKTCRLFEWISIYIYLVPACFSGTKYLNWKFLFIYIFIFACSLWVLDGAWKNPP